jgi:hypothetical protein
VSQHGQRPGATNAFDLSRRGAHAFEEGRVLDVRGRRIPGVEAAFLGEGKGLPEVVAFEHLGVTCAIHLRVERGRDRVADLCLAGPDVGQEDRLSVLSVSERLVVDVDVGATGERERHDENG